MWPSRCCRTDSCNRLRDEDLYLCSGNFGARARGITPVIEGGKQGEQTRILTQR